MLRLDEYGTQYDKLIGKYLMFWGKSGQQKGTIQDVISLMKFLRESRKEKKRVWYFVSVSSGYLFLLIEDNEPLWPDKREWRLRIKYSDISPNVEHIAFHFGRLLSNISIIRGGKMFKFRSSAMPERKQIVHKITTRIKKSMWGYREDMSDELFVNNFIHALIMIQNYEDKK